MTFDVDALQQQIPYYLAADPDRKAFLAELKALSDGVTAGYYIQSGRDPYRETILQGDGWRGFQVFSFNSGERKRLKGIVLSNSCDVSADNERVSPPNVTFAPIVRLSRLRQRFEARGFRQDQIESRIRSITSQHSTGFFYLPADGPLDEDYVALLDDLHSMPVAVHQQEAEKLFTLSMAGFYLFVFKLSIHFCRLHENVERTSRASVT